MVSPQRTGARSAARVLVLVLGVMLIGASFIPNASAAVSSPTTRFITTAPPPTPTPIHDSEKHGG